MVKVKVMQIPTIAASSARLRSFR